MNGQRNVRRTTQHLIGSVIAALGLLIAVPIIVYGLLGGDDDALTASRWIIIGAAVVVVLIVAIAIRRSKTAGSRGGGS